MVIAQWLERGLGQWVAPDGTYEAQPDQMDTQSEVWQIMAPDPNFSSWELPYTSARTPRGQLSTSENDDDELTTVFLSPTPVKWNPRKPYQQRRQEEPSVSLQKGQGRHDMPGQGLFAGTQDGQEYNKDGDNNDNEEQQQEEERRWVQEQILMASRDTMYMKQRNAKFRDQATKLLQYCCSQVGNLQDKSLQKIQKLLQTNAKRLQATDYAEPNLLVQARSHGMGNACPDGHTPLHAAALAGQTAAAQLLFASAQNDCDDDHNHNNETVQIMLEQTNLFGQTALHIAAAHGQVEMVQFLQEQEQRLLQQQEQPQQPSIKQEHNDDDDEKKEANTPTTTTGTVTTPTAMTTTTTTPPPNEGTPTTTTTTTTPVGDVTGQTAWGTAMTSPNLKARKHRQRLDQLLSTPLQYQNTSKKKRLLHPWTTTTTTDTPTSPPPTPAAALGFVSHRSSSSSCSRNNSRESRLHHHSRVHWAPAPLQVRYTTAHLDGRRVWNEDAVLCTPLDFCQGLLCLICDGHGDSGSVAHFVAQHLPTALAAAAAAAAEATTTTAPPPAVSSETMVRPEKQEEEDAGKSLSGPVVTTMNNDPYWTTLCQTAAADLDRQLQNAYLAGGCTAVWAIVTATQIVVANVGDSRCILVQQQEQNDKKQQPQDGDGSSSNTSNNICVTALSQDHKPNLPWNNVALKRLVCKLCTKPIRPMTATTTVTTTTTTKV